MIRFRRKRLNHEVIIVGCGKVGKILAEELNKEDNEVTVIDRLS